MAGLLASVSLGIVGSYVVTRRITYIAAAISHCVLGGIGAALYLQVVWRLALVRSDVRALWPPRCSRPSSSALVSLYARQREDTVISAIWAVGMAIGLLVLRQDARLRRPDELSVRQHPADLPPRPVAGAGAGRGGGRAGLGFYPKLLAVCFDEEFAELRGVRVKLYYLLLLCLTALTVVLLVRVVGIVLVIALLTLPAAVAGHFARQLWQMMALAVLSCAVFVTAGLAVSYRSTCPAAR